MKFQGWLLAFVASGVSLLLPRAAAMAGDPSQSAPRALKLTRLTARLVANATPYITSVGMAPLSQGQTVVVAGRHFGDVPGALMLKGAFLVNGVSTPLTVELPLTGGIWEDTVVGAGPIPTNLVGLDQQISFQVKTRDNKLSNERKVAFVTQREIKLLSPSAMKGTSDQVSCPTDMVPGVTNTIGIVCESDTTKARCTSDDNKMRKHVWTAELKDYQKYDSWLFGHWVGNFPTAPTFFSLNNHLSYSVPWTFEHTSTYSYRWGLNTHDAWICNIGYFVNFYYSTPTGMD